MTPTELRQLLADHEWRTTFDPRTLQRGYTYARDGRVETWRIESSAARACVLEGEIRGRGHQRYHCRIEIQFSDAWAIVESDCDCPVELECKHAAALLYVAAGEVDAAHATDPHPPPPGSEAWYEARAAQAELAFWLVRLESLQAPVDAAPVAAPERQFGIILRGDDAPSPRLEAALVWTRPSRQAGREGRPVDPESMRLDADLGPVPTPPSGWSDADATTLALLLELPARHQGKVAWITIESRHAERALEALLDQHPTWFERAGQTVVRGPARRGEPYWEEAADGSQRPRFRVGGEAVLLLRGAGVWYVDRERAEYGRVEIDRALFDHVQSAPILRPRQLDAVRERMAKLASGTALPPPIDHGGVEVVDSAPTPVLRLEVETMRTWSRRNNDIGIARLAFRYGDALVDGNETRAVVTRLVAGKVREIHRDATSEQRWRDALHDHGLKPLLMLSGGYLSNRDAAAGGWFAHRGGRTTPLAPDEWAPLIGTLERAGFEIEAAPAFAYQRSLPVDAWDAELTPGGGAWFDVTLGIDVDGERIDLLPLLRQMIADPRFPLTPARGEKKHATWTLKLDDRRQVELPLARLRTLIEPLLEWLQGDAGEEAPRLHRSQIEALDDRVLAWRGGEALRREIEALRERPSVRPPAGFKATLRPYQLDGLDWLGFLADAGLGGILADDMGLGKTVQVLAHLLAEKQRGRLDKPALVVAPTSLVGNWQAEAARFAPDLRVVVLHGADRAERFAELAGADLAITTYPLLPRDKNALVAASFSLLVLDEAQAIKNPASRAAKIVRALPATRRLAMTGTPLENHLGELWAQFDAVEPGLLGSRRQFTKFYRTPIEKRGDDARQARLNRRVKSLLLRRRKDDVLTDLPAKTESVLLLELEDDQRALYEALRLAQHERVKQAVAERGLARSGIVVIDALLKLRQACCDPRLVKLASARKVASSAKLDAALELIEGLVDDGRRILLFSQFTEMLGLIEQALGERKLAWQTLTGQTPASERSALVARFQRGEVPLFLISLKAGGVGLNLTAADTVIHYDPWWNPAVEAQATDRAHRIGQTKPVFVYRLICKDTVEEKIQALQARKAGLAKAVLEGGGASTGVRFSESDLDALFGGL